MKPSFPFNLFRYDLAFIPGHDRGWLPRGTVRVQGSLSRIEPEILQVSTQSLTKDLRSPEKIRFSVFLGGETKRCKPTPEAVERLLRALEQIGETASCDYVVTTSRRTPEAIIRLLRDRIQEFRHCQLCVIASQDPRPEVVPGMMGLAEFLLVTEDSLSMISEALSSGKKVVIVRWEHNGLAAKHYRFQKALEKRWGVPVVEVNELDKVFRNGLTYSSRNLYEDEKRRIREKMESLL